MKKCVFLVLSFFIFSLVAGMVDAEVFEVKEMREITIKVAAKDKASGENRWQSTLKTQKIKYQGKPFIYIEENGAGLYGNDEKLKEWKAEGYFHWDGTQLIPYSVKETMWDSEGNLVRNNEKFYDQEKGKVFCKVDDEEKEFDFKSDLIDRQIIGICLMNYPFEEKREFDFHLLTSIPSQYKMTMKHKGIETIEVGGEMIECHKLQMEPDLGGALNLINVFVPDTYFWYTVSSPHRFVRYEGLETGLGTPYVIMERVN